MAIYKETYQYLDGVQGNIPASVRDRTASSAKLVCMKCPSETPSGENRPTAQVVSMKWPPTERARQPKG